MTSEIEMYTGTYVIVVFFLGMFFGGLIMR
jgi:hypothetical protein